MAAGGLLVSAIYFNIYLLSSLDTAPTENKNLDFNWKIRRLSSESPGWQPLLNQIPPTKQHKGSCGFVYWMRTSDPFYNHRDALTAADAGCCETVALAPATQFVENRKHQSRAGCAKWMAEGYRPSVHVGSRTIQA